jgi:ligand-binding SRPBCC domain-containing protein
MLTGPLRKWRHLHRFNDIYINEYQKQTEVIDEVDFELSYNPIGKLFEGYVCKRLEKFFDYRKAATIKTLEDNT